MQAALAGCDRFSLVVVQGTMACSRVIFSVALVGMLAWCAHASLPDVGKDMADIVSEKGYPIEECELADCLALVVEV